MKIKDIVLEKDIPRAQLLDPDYPHHFFILWMWKKDRISLNKYTLPNKRGRVYHMGAVGNAHDLASLACLIHPLVPSPVDHLTPKG